MCCEDESLSETLSETRKQLTSGTPFAQCDADPGHVCLLTSLLDDVQVLIALMCGMLPSSSMLTRPLRVVQQNA